MPATRVRSLEGTVSIHVFFWIHYVLVLIYPERHEHSCTCRWFLWIYVIGAMLIDSIYFNQIIKCLDLTGRDVVSAMTTHGSLDPTKKKPLNLKLDNSTWPFCRAAFALVSCLFLDAFFLDLTLLDWLFCIAAFTFVSWLFLNDLFLDLTWLDLTLIDFFA
jgi:hypothetical protein